MRSNNEASSLEPREKEITSEQSYLDIWRATAEEILETGGISMVLGGTDTGKTTFFAFLANTLLRAGKRVALVDVDMGQSDIGPPTTIGLAILDKPFGSLDEIAPDALYFIGSTSPRGHLLPTVVGTKKLVDKGLAKGAELVIINTTGLVHGSMARALKHHKINLVRPQHLIVLQRNNEIEAIVSPWEGVTGFSIHRPPIYQKLRMKSQLERRFNRETKFRSYFTSARPVEISLERVISSRNIFRSGRELAEAQLKQIGNLLDCKILYGEKENKELFLVTEVDCGIRELFRVRSQFGVEKIYVNTPEDFSDLLVGIYDRENELIAIGILEKIDFSKREIRVITPLDNDRSIGRIELGLLRINSQGEELGRLNRRL